MRLSHDVYFTLEDASRNAREKLVEACHRYLKNHEGIEFFSAGTLAEEFAREVNDREFHVALHVVFRDKAAHDAYQSVEDHQTFVAEHEANWKRVRVFDSYVTS